jgi:lysophospholipase L1-like esterase
MVASVLLVACGGTPLSQPSTPEAALRYVALGDSYSIGTSVQVDEAWPNQLVARLDGRLVLVANLGVNGYASADLIEDELPRLADLQPTFVSVQIGVNDVVRGVSEPSYVANVATIFDALLGLVPADRIVAVATPDYTVTPMGAAFGNAAQQSAAIVAFNADLRDAAEARGIAFVPEIFAISRAAATDRGFVAGDGLHPSGAQYARWVDAIVPVVESLLAAR